MKEETETPECTSYCCRASERETDTIESQHMLPQVTIRCTACRRGRAIFITTHLLQINSCVYVLAIMASVVISRPRSISDDAE